MELHSELFTFNHFSLIIIEKEWAMINSFDKKTTY